MFIKRIIIPAFSILTIGCFLPEFNLDHDQHRADPLETEELPKRSDYLYYNQVRTFLVNKSQYYQTKQDIQNSNNNKPLTRLVKQADKIVNDPTLHTIVRKKVVPLNGDAHDFFTIPRYWHPNPMDKMKPWIHKDGVVNPLSESPEDDKVQLKTMCRKVHTLARAYFYTNNQVYGKKATQLIHNFFINSNTYMSPSLKFGGYVQGKYNSRIIGTIETANLILVIESIGLLTNYEGWTPEYQSAMLDWFDDYLNWLLTSKQGKLIKKVNNNIANWFDLQIVCYALFTGRTQLAKNILSAVGWKRLDKQVNKNRFFVEEIDRAQSFSYHIYSLKALTYLANVSENIGGYDIWNHYREETKLLAAVIQNMGKYVDPSENWPYLEKGGVKTPELYLILRRASRAYSDNSYELLIDSIDKDFTSDIENLQYPKLKFKVKE
jgi:hypothetical protein